MGGDPGAGKCVGVQFLTHTHTQAAPTPGTQLGTPRPMLLPRSESLQRIISLPNTELHLFIYQYLQASSGSSLDANGQGHPQSQGLWINILILIIIWLVLDDTLPKLLLIRSSPFSCQQNAELSWGWETCSTSNPREKPLSLFFNGSLLHNRGVARQQPDLQSQSIS